MSAVYSFMCNTVSHVSLYFYIMALLFIPLTQGLNSDSSGNI